MNWKIFLFICLVVGAGAYFAYTQMQQVPKNETPAAYVNQLQQDEAKARNAAGLANLDTVKGAVEKYRLEKGSNPASLQDLVPNFLDHVPDNVTYDPATGTVGVAQ